MKFITLSRNAENHLYWKPKFLWSRFERLACLRRSQLGLWDSHVSTSTAVGFFGNKRGRWMEFEWATRVNDPLASAYSPVSWRPALVSSLHARRKMRKARTEGGGRCHVSDADVGTHAHTPKTSDQRSRESWDDASHATHPAFQQQEYGSKLAI